MDEQTKTLNFQPFEEEYCVIAESHSDKKVKS